jgi:hypothetical protein
LRRVNRWLIGAPSLLAVVTAGVVVYFGFMDTAYFRTDLHADTALAAVANKGQGTGFVSCEERSGRVTLSFARGDRGGLFGSSPARSENLAVELAWPAAGDKIELDRAVVRIAFAAFDGWQFAVLGGGGVRGHIQIESADQSGIVASYDIFVDAVFTHRLAADRHQEINFRGRSTFRATPRPGGARPGELWPKSTPRPKVGDPVTADAGLRTHLSSMVSPPARVKRAHRVAGSIDFLMNRTDPSAIAAWNPST